MSDLTYVEIDIARPAAETFGRLCDLGSVPRWVPGVAGVRVLATDDAGRITRAQFVGMPSRGSFAYELAYEYDEAAMTMRWSSQDRTLRDLTGEATVIAAGDGCRLRYGLRASATEVLPHWAQLALREESPEPIVQAFRRWVESS